MMHKSIAYSFKRYSTKSGIINTILHGTGENDLGNGTHSLRLGKPKLLFEIQFHHVKPSSMPSYMSLINRRFPTLFGPSQHSKLFGSWSTQVGRTDQFVHIFQYEGHAGYDTAYELRQTSKDWQQYEQECRDLLNHQENHLCQEFAFIGQKQTIHPAKGIYEFRTYQLKPGHLIEWSTLWRDGLTSKKKETNNLVGAWFSQLGSLYQVHHMWYYQDLHARRELRDQFWKDENWSESVAKTVKFIQTMDAQILKLMESSPKSFL